MLAGAAASPKVSGAFVRALAESVEAIGVSRELLLGDLALVDLSQAAVGLDLEQLDAMVERAIALTGDPALGLHWWERAGFGAFGAVGHALSVARSFRAGVELITRYWPLFTNVPLISVVEDASVVRIRLSRNSPSALAHRAYMEAGAFALRRFLRQCVGVQGLPLGVCFDYPEPAYVTSYVESLGCPLRFESPFTELAISLEYVDCPHPNHAADLEAHLLGYAEARLHEGNSQDLAQRVLQVLRSGPDTHRMTMEDVAARLGLGERTLRRRLQRAATPYPALMQRALREQAELMLREKKLSVKQIALALGFADSSAFYRAVRRWTGQAPSELRAGTSSVPKQVS